MKKLLILLGIISFVLMGCHSNETSISVIVPNGIPSIAQSPMEYDDEIYDIDRITGPAPLTAAFTSASHDVIIAPINLGANLYQKGANYKLAGVLTWSNLQIVSRTEIHSLSDLVGSNIIAFGEGAIPEIVISYLFSEANLDDVVHIQYDATSVQESLMMFLQGSDFAIVSEPTTSQALDSEDDIYVYDLAEAWTHYTGYDLFPQAGVFVRNNLSEDIVNKYLDDLDLATTETNNDPEIVAGYCAELSYPFDEDLIANAIPSSHIDFQPLSESRSAVNDMLQIIYENKPALIGGEIPDEAWYYTPS